MSIIEAEGGVMRHPCKTMCENTRSSDKPRGWVKGEMIVGGGEGGRGKVWHGWVSLFHLLPNCSEETSFGFQPPHGLRLQ
jgi:hypothetical protein